MESFFSIAYRCLREIRPKIEGLNFCTFRIPNPCAARSTRARGTKKIKYLRNYHKIQFFNDVKNCHYVATLGKHSLTSKIKDATSNISDLYLFYLAYRIISARGTDFMILRCVLARRKRGPAPERLPP